MSISTENTILENQQTPNDNQEVINGSNESPESNTPEYNQDTNVEFEKSKSRLEYISFIIAIMSLVSTGLIKALSLGRYLRFTFDANNCELNLTNTDLINLFISIFFCATAFFYIYFIHQWLIKFCNKVSNHIHNSTKILLMYLILTMVPTLLYFLLGTLFIYLFCFIIKDFETYKYYLLIPLSISTCFVFLLSNSAISSGKKIDKSFKILSMFILIVIGISFVHNDYERALNQTTFEIIEAVDNNGQLQKYVVISKGNLYSAYQCSMGTENDKILTIHTDIHRYFPLENTETRWYYFEGYRFVIFESAVNYST